jgi:hypothetical protein
MQVATLASHNEAGQGAVAQPSADVAMEIVAPPATGREPRRVQARFDKVPCEIKIAQFGVDDLAETFGIDTAKIETWDSTLLLDKIIEGPLDIMGVWTIISVVMAFFPGRYKSAQQAREAIKNKVNDHSLKLEMVEIKNDQVILVNFCIINFTGTKISI